MYRPYLVGNVSNRGNDRYSPRRERIGAQTGNRGPVFVLNKTLRHDIVSYAQAVSNGVTDLRTATKQTTQGMENFNRAVYHEGYEAALEGLQNSLARFAEGFTSSAGFMAQQRHSSGLSSFSGEIAGSVYDNRERLAPLGITLSDDGTMSFNRATLTGRNHAQVNEIIHSTRPVFEGLRAYSAQLMTEPLIEHMRFNGLNYHYNYRLGTMETEGFSLLETGMLVDRLV
jgi:hypothetical protein